MTSSGRLLLQPAGARWMVAGCCCRCRPAVRHGCVRTRPGAAAARAPACALAASSPAAGLLRVVQRDVQVLQPEGPGRRAVQEDQEGRAVSMNRLLCSCSVCSCSVCGKCNALRLAACAAGSRWSALPCGHALAQRCGCRWNHPRRLMMFAPTHAPCSPPPRPCAAPSALMSGAFLFASNNATGQQPHWDCGGRSLSVQRQADAAVGSRQQRSCPGLLLRAAVPPSMPACHAAEVACTASCVSGLCKAKVNVHFGLFLCVQD